MLALLVPVSTSADNTKCGKAGVVSKTMQYNNIGLSEHFEEETHIQKPANMGTKNDQTWVQYL